MNNLNRLLLVMLAAVALPAHASWYLDNESSRLSFTSTKNADIAEVHRFLVLHGKVTSKGLAEVEVETESVSTGIPCVMSAFASKCFRWAGSRPHRSALNSTCAPSMPWRPAPSWNCACR